MRGHPNVTKKTTILVVGEQDISLLAGHDKSIKHRKAELLALEGQPIRIIRESDFDALIRAVEEGAARPVSESLLVAHDPPAPV
jgi:DNA polymerase-3 subunit epsilon